jgi:hypothetical protein
MYNAKENDRRMTGESTEAAFLTAYAEVNCGLRISATPTIS